MRELARPVPGRSRHLGHPVHPEPLSGSNVERSPIRSAQNAGECTAIQRNLVQHPATFRYPDASLCTYVGKPARTLRIQTNPVRSAAFRPNSSAGEAPVRSDVKGRQATSPRLCDNQSRVIRRHGHTIREGEIVGDLMNSTVWLNEHNGSGRTTTDFRVRSCLRSRKDSPARQLQFHSSPSAGNVKDRHAEQARCCLRVGEAAVHPPQERPCVHQGGSQTRAGGAAGANDHLAGSVRILASNFAWSPNLRTIADRFASAGIPRVKDEPSK